MDKFTKRVEVIGAIATCAKGIQSARGRAATFQVSMVEHMRRGRALGLTFREMGEAAGISPQRVEQLTREEDPK